MARLVGGSVQAIDMNDPASLLVAGDFDSISEDSSEQITIDFTDGSKVVIGGTNLDVQFILPGVPIGASGTATSAELFDPSDASVVRIDQISVDVGDFVDAALNDQLDAFVTDIFSGPDELVGTSFADTLTGLGGDDDISGRGGADVLEGGSGDDTISGGSGNDDIDGGAGDDTVLGLFGRDKILGGSGNDDLSGNAANDRLFGQGGNDILRGGSANDLLNGGAGRDTLLGGGGRDDLVGGNAIDFLDGGLGQDTLAGGAAGDSFFFLQGDGVDTILDFETGLDTVDLTQHLGVAGTGDIVKDTVSGDAVARLGSDSITFVGLTWDADLFLSDFTV